MVCGVVMGRGVMVVRWCVCGGEMWVCGRGGRCVWGWVLVVDTRNDGDAAATETEMEMEMEMCEGCGER